MPEIGKPYVRAYEGPEVTLPSVKFNAIRVTGVWSDGLDITEEHKSWESADDFIGELSSVDSIVKIIIEKVCV